MDDIQRPVPMHRLGTVLTYSDLTPASDPVLQWAARIAIDGGASLVIVHATGLVGAPLGEALPRLLDGHTDELRMDLEAQMLNCLPSGAEPGRCTLRHELPWRAVHLCAAEVRPGLVVADPSAMQVRRRAVTDLDPTEVVRRIGAPLLIPHGMPRWPVRGAVSVTVGADAPAETSELREALDLSRSAGRPLLLVPRTAAEGNGSASPSMPSAPRAAGERSRPSTGVVRSGLTPLVCGIRNLKGEST